HFVSSASRGRRASRRTASLTSTGTPSQPPSRPCAHCEPNMKHEKKGEKVHLASRIVEAKSDLAVAMDKLAVVVKEIQKEPRAQKTTISEAAARALDEVRAAQR